ncbi:PREDICTED: uncharacterized protein LOC109327706 [Lupinus angustifolius]|uniref:uncharacterized protein LOC109327706 n=1 Tax=Lupinus angustifolius TaxID=3871 RepID=UPI00092EBACD|nr:PREDICTED: uncharacterized protein LOC109327706 [Lupinus angustifolius]
MANQLMNPILDPASPYYLSPNENPGVVLVSGLMNGENYHPWSRAMTMALKTKNKLAFVDGSLPKPPPHDQMCAIWNRFQSVLQMNNAKEIWDDLKERYHQGVIFRISELIGEMHSARQGNASIDKFFTQMKALWQQLDNYMPIPPCECEVKCHYALIPTMKNYRENEYVICFLRGLNDQYSSVRLQIMLMQPLLAINNVFSILIQQEKQMMSENPALTTSYSSFINNDTRQIGRGGGRGYRASMSGRSNIQGRSGTYTRGRGHKTCTFYQRTGHTIDTYYKNHGFPPSYSTNGTNINWYSGANGQIGDQDDTIKTEYKE